MKKLHLLLLLFVPLFSIAQSVYTTSARVEIDSLFELVNQEIKQDNYEKTTGWLDQAEQSILSAFGKESDLYATLLNKRGALIASTGDHEQAESLYLESMAIRERVVGKGHPDYASSLHNLANLYSKLGQYTKAEPLYLESLEIREEAFGKENKPVVLSHIGLGVLYYFTGDYPKSEHHYQQSLTISEKIFGIEDRFYIVSMENLGILYNTTGEFAKAESLYLAALATSEKVFGKEHQDYANNLFSLAVLYAKTGDYQKAETLYLESLTIREKVLGKKNEKYAKSLEGLGNLYTDTGAYDKADSLYQEAMAIYEHMFGKEHPDYAAMLNNLAILYQIKGEFDRSIAFYLESLDIYEGGLGKTHPRYAASLTNLGTLYREMDNYGKAEPLYQEILAIYEKVYGKDHPNYAIGLVNMAGLYADMDHNLKAESTYQEALARLEKVIGKEHYYYAVSLSNLASLYYGMGEYAKAERILPEVLAIQQKVLGREHKDYASSLYTISGIYQDMSNYAKAEPLLQEALAIIEKVLGKEHPDYALFQGSLGNLYQNTGEYTKADSLLQDALAIQEKVFGKEHTLYANGLYNLGNLYNVMNLYSKAEPLYLEATAIQEKVFGESHSEYAKSLNALGLLYQKMGNYGKADSLLQEALRIQEKVLGKENISFLASLNNLGDLYWLTSQYPKAATQYLELNEISRTLLARASLHLSEKELFEYRYAFDIRQSKLASFSLIQEGLTEANYNNTLFHKGFIMNAVQGTNRLAQADSTSRELFLEHQSYLRRLAAEYAKPISERKNVDTLEVQANELEKALIQTVAGYGDAIREVKWTEVQATLKEGEAAIEFIHFDYMDPEETDSLIYAAMVLRPQDEKPQFIPLFEEQQLANLLTGNEEGRLKYEVIAEVYSRGLVPNKETQTDGLYQMIWQPIDSLLTEVKTIYFAPTGLLHRINLDAIPIDSSLILADRYQLNSLTSTRQLVASQDTIGSNGLSAAIFGGIRYDVDSTFMRDTIQQNQLEDLALSPLERTEQEPGQNWSFLSGTDREANEIGEIILQQEGAVIVFKGYAATEESFKALSRQGASPRIIHLATHGYFYPDPVETVGGMQSAVGSLNPAPAFKISDHPMIRSGLILAGSNHAWSTGKPLRPGMEDGILTAYEISQMNLDSTELVVLSACETGLGDIEGNEGVYGLQRAFKIAGVKNIIMSLWSVPDQQTQEMMVAFYAHWLEGGMELAEAFRAAQSEMREKYLDHYYWAGFVLVE